MAARIARLRVPAVAATLLLLVLSIRPAAGSCLPPTLAIAQPRVIHAGDTATIIGTGWSATPCPNGPTRQDSGGCGQAAPAVPTALERVHLEIRSTDPTFGEVNLADTVANSGGALRTNIVIPGELGPGNYVITASGPSGGQAETMVLRVVEPGARQDA